MLNPALTNSRSRVSNSAFDSRGECVEVRQRPRVARNHDGVIPKLFLRRFQAFLRATRHQNARASIKEHLRRSEPHAARAADDYHLFTFVPFHMNSPGEWLLFVLSP